MFCHFARKEMDVMDETSNKTGIGEESPNPLGGRHGPGTQDTRSRRESPAYDAMRSFFIAEPNAPRGEDAQAKCEEVIPLSRKRAPRRRAEHKLFSIYDPFATEPYRLITEETEEERKRREDQLANPLKYAGSGSGFVIGYDEYPDPDPIVMNGPMQDIFQIRKNPLLLDWHAWPEKIKQLYLVCPAPIDPNRVEFGPAQIARHLDNLVKDCSFIVTGKVDTSLSRLNRAALSPTQGKDLAHCVTFWNACKEHKVSPAVWIAWKFASYKFLTRGGTKKINILWQVLSPIQVGRNEIRGIYRAGNPIWNMKASMLRGGEAVHQRIQRLRCNLDRMCIYRDFRVSNADIQFLMDRIFPGGTDRIKILLDQMLRYCEVRNGIWRQAAMEGRFLWGSSLVMRNH
jgi:hypothetical protein